MGDLYGVSPAAGLPDAATTPERILDTAARLFYTRGVCAVGVNEINTESGTAKATFTGTFSAKARTLTLLLDGALSTG